jgi:hypothetical protein
MTGMSQPLDVVIDQPFKTHIRRSYSKWAQKTHEMPPMGHLKKAMLTKMCWWILEAWRYDSEKLWS